METTNFFEQVALWSQVLGAVAFLIVLILLFRKYLIPAVVANEKARNAELADAEARRTRMQADAAKARAEVETAERDAAEIIRRVESAARHDREHMIAEAEAEGLRILHNAEGELDRARHSARARLRIEFIEKALAKAREEAPARVTEAIDETLVRTTVDDLAAGNA
jgi:F0F1-type ATP synthase membrane subunit b/b'